MQKVNRINNIGLSLLEYKEELLKDYPKIVKNSLISSVEQMLANEVIDTVVYELIISENEDCSSFKEYILSNKNYTKTHAEILKEFEEIRIKFDEILKDKEIYGLVTSSMVEEDSIFAVKTFRMDEEFLMEYFGVDERDLNSLMKKKGFAEKFAALRLTKIINDIIEKSNKLTNKTTLDNSLAFLDDVRNSYNIELIIKIDINSMDFDDEEMFEEIREIEAESSLVYKSMMNLE